MAEPRGTLLYTIDPNDKSSEIDFSKPEFRATVYYAWCNPEGRQIGADTFDRQVAINAANNHANQTNHATSVYSYNT